MIINFPFSPKIDQVYIQGNLSWQWNGVQWVEYNSVSNGGGITGYITSGGVLTLGSTGSSANGASTIVTRDADGSFIANSITVNNGLFDGSLRTVSQVVNGGSVTGTIVGNTLTLGGGAGAGATSVVNASGINGVIISSTLTLSVSNGAFANSVTNGGGITGFITGGGALTLGSTGSSSNGASTIVTRGADGSFAANVMTATTVTLTGTITAAYGNIWGNAGTGSATFTGGTTLARISGNTSSYSEPRLEFGEQTNNATAAIASKNEANGGGSLYFLTRNTTAGSSTQTRIRITGDGNLIVYGNILSNLANGEATIGNATAYFGNIFGTAMLSRYADLAESYSSDQKYDPGTVVEFGGLNEITLATNETPRVAGVISTKPAYLMNMDQQGDNMLAVALQGRVPCKVKGVIHKGDMMVSAGNGFAKACSNPKVGTIIGKALENYFSSADGIIEVVVGIR